MIKLSIKYFWKLENDKVVLVWVGYRTALTVFHAAGRPELKPVIPIVSSYETYRNLALLPPSTERYSAYSDNFFTYEYIL